MNSFRLDLYFLKKVAHNRFLFPLLVSTFISSASALNLDIGLNKWTFLKHKGIIYVGTNITQFNIKKVL